jgi:hypothetical protein
VITSGLTQLMILASGWARLPFLRARLEQTAAGGRGWPVAKVARVAMKTTGQLDAGAASPSTLLCKEICGPMRHPKPTDAGPT